MKTIYVDSEFKCHISNDGTMTPVETDFFDGMCDAYIEGFCYENNEISTAIYAWKPYDELDTAQREYERQLLAEAEAALASSVPIADLTAAYQEGVNTAYDQ